MKPLNFLNEIFDCFTPNDRNIPKSLNVKAPTGKGRITQPNLIMYNDRDYEHNNVLYLFLISYAKTFRNNNGALIKPTNQLVELLDNTNSPDPSLLSLLKLPFDNLYIDLGVRLLVNDNNTSYPLNVSGVFINNVNLSGSSWLDFLFVGKHVNSNMPWSFKLCFACPDEHDNLDAETNLLMALVNHTRKILYQFLTEEGESFFRNHRLHIEHKKDNGDSLSIDEEIDLWCANLLAIPVLVNQIFGIIFYMNLDDFRYELVDEESKAKKLLRQSRGDNKKFIAATKAIKNACNYISVGPLDKPGYTTDDHKDIVKSESEKRDITPHWRRGHFHTYRSGYKRGEIKLKWLKPILVNKDKVAADHNKISPKEYKVK